MKPKELYSEKLGLDKQLFILLLNHMKKENLPTSFALIAHSCEKQGLNITLQELERIFNSFEEESQLYLKTLFNIVEPRLYRKLKKLNDDNDLTKDQIESIQLIREYKTSINPTMIFLSNLVSFDSEEQRDEQVLDLRKTFDSFSLEAQQFLNNKYKFTQYG